MSASSYAHRYLEEVQAIAAAIDADRVERIAALLAAIRDDGGRLFFLGVGGGAAQACHAAADFRKIAGMECYAPTDNVAELTARINDHGWDSSYAQWLRGSRLGPRDAVFVFSVGGGSVEPRVSMNLVAGLELAREVGARILGVVGRDGGVTARMADACLIVPPVNPGAVTPHTEEFQAVLSHLLVTHPRLRRNEMKWESGK
ncbi:MAG: SIS domain-containing protein [Acidobacteriaceae bacterium]